jgi:hypothetical protein
MRRKIDNLPKHMVSNTFGVGREATGLPEKPSRTGQFTENGNKLNCPVNAALFS